VIRRRDGGDDVAEEGCYAVIFDFQRRLNGAQSGRGIAARWSVSGCPDDARKEKICSSSPRQAAEQPPTRGAHHGLFKQDVNPHGGQPIPVMLSSSGGPQAAAALQSDRTRPPASRLDRRRPLAGLAVGEVGALDRRDGAIGDLLPSRVRQRARDYETAANGLLCHGACLPEGAARTASTTAGTTTGAPMGSSAAGRCWRARRGRFRRGGRTTRKAWMQHAPEMPRGHRCGRACR
jgi:hypothetical protein